jgi:4-hydroxyphenylpyruvate dioxygenase
MYHGEGVQHIALAATSTTRWTSLPGVKLLDTSDTYYELLPSASRLKADRRAAVAQHPGRRPQASCCCRSSAKTAGPIFFEFIQRKGNEGFGEGNFKACSRPWSWTRFAAALKTGA